MPVPYALSRIATAATFEYTALARMELTSIGYEHVDVLRQGDSRSTPDTDSWSAQHALHRCDGLLAIWHEDWNFYLDMSVVIGMAVALNLNVVVVCPGDLINFPSILCASSRVTRFETLDDALNQYYRRIRNLYDTERRVSRVGDNS